MIRVDFRRQLGDFHLEATFEVGDETLVLFGHSGSGKSLTLNAIAGLMRPDAGRIEVGERVVFDAAEGVNVPPQERDVGYLIQQIALFPHMTAEENIAAGLGGWERTRRNQRVAELEHLLGLEGLGERLPHQLSGGQQQRVALARALARPIEALLLDEPFTALDEVLRAELRAEIIRLRATLHIPVIFVTHDLREAHLLADRIAVYDGGRILQFATRDELFRHPASRRVAELTGIKNIFPATRRDGDTVDIEGAAFRTGISPEVVGTDASAAIDVCIRAERCLLRRIDVTSERLPENCFLADVAADFAFGNTHTLRVHPVGPGPEVELEIAAHPYEVLAVATTPRWVVELPADALHVMRRVPPAATRSA